MKSSASPESLADDRADHHLKVLIERLVYEGRSEREIEVAVLEATGQPTLGARLRAIGLPAWSGFAPLKAKGLAPLRIRGGKA